MGRIFAIVPVKPFSEGKSRLRPVLSDPERLALNERFFGRTLRVAAEFPGRSSTIVVSRSPEVLANARMRGMIGLAETEGQDLNAALAQGTELAIAMGASGVLVLPVDLPLLSASSLRAAVGLATATSLVLAPDRHRRGTNLLFQQPVRLLRYRFGPDSYARHQADGQAVGLEVALCQDQELALDVDRPADLSLYRETTLCPP